ncbi:alpha-D-ribose 1-methylphosphonate 5-triphosphate synthase subunit PhnG [Mesorhizobium sp. J18]|uniref:phosphonate C-P lyase system protein PhnG n=1 Tax=Mesorhizobium sp. J18 TaxID=935263 RepID=UPI0011996B38|nr:phosphonate C-P lyase system protein PhnG [Mesorhizobium sp. J18]TWG91291.1 alpha-D-ribose 1-methylphosphonate 5-triphosphate synthase subunit PhnG [Mesorhizobium sp. J18]
MTPRNHQTTERRREAMAILAAAPARDLMRLWEQSGLPDDAQLLRGPETGLVTLRGRMGGGGAPFNFGEATVTRATVKLPEGEVGHAYALGRDLEKVRVAAIIDALRQRAEHAELVEERILSPLRQALAEADTRKRAETAATKVDFFTLVRGED